MDAGLGQSALAREETARSNARWRGWPRAALAASLASALILAAAVGSAGDMRVLLVGPSEADATVVRVRQELTLLGLDVEVVTRGASTDLAALARDHGAAAVARVEDAPPEIVLWVDAAHSAGLPQESRVSETFSGRAEPGLLALRAVELLRGRLIPVAATADAAAPSATSAPEAPSAAATTAPSASAASTAAPSSSAAATSAPRVIPQGPAPDKLHPQAARTPRGSAHLGPAISMSPGGLPVAPALRIGGAWRVVERLDLDAVAMIPLTAATVAANEGSMDLRVLALGAGADVLLTDPAWALALRAGAGLGIAGFFFEGHAKAPWVSASGSQWSALPYLQAGAGYRLTPLLSLRADVLAAIVRPEPVLVIAGNRAGSFGTPAVFGSLSLEVHP
jgi:hypothetical protein